jgi:hypothetical protein
MVFPPANDPIRTIQQDQRGVYYAQLRSGVVRRINPLVAHTLLGFIRRRQQRRRRMVFIMIFVGLVFGMGYCAFAKPVGEEVLGGPPRVTFSTS